VSNRYVECAAPLIYPKLTHSKLGKFRRDLKTHKRETAQIQQRESGGRNDVFGERKVCM
jgi:hypothetical protein